MISDLIDRHLRVAGHAVDLFGSLRQQMNDGRAQHTAVRRAGITFHLSGELHRPGLHTADAPVRHRSRPGGAAAARGPGPAGRGAGMAGEFPAPPGAAGPPGTEPPAGRAGPGGQGFPAARPGRHP